jgi:hypothetical protein
MKAGFPLPADEVTKVFAALRLDAPPLQRASYDLAQFLMVGQFSPLNSSLTVFRAATSWADALTPSLLTEGPSSCVLRPSFAGTFFGTLAAPLVASGVGLLILVAAAAWGYGTHLMRRHLTTMPVIALTFWMLVLTLGVMALASVLFERAAWRAPTPLEWASIIYNMAIAIAFCHVAWARLARTLPPAASGLSVMLIPVVGVFSSLWLLGETPHWQDYAALLLILVALSTVLLGGRPQAR